MEVSAAGRGRGSEEQNHIAKGKRTMRQRVQKRTSSNENFHRSDRDRQEEQYMANCLILLARGHSTKLPSSSSSFKFNTRRFMEAAHNGGGKVGYYVYECRSCGRTFPSFQALGGHRASHKKPINQHSPISDLSPDDNQEDISKAHEVGNSCVKLRNNKVHECAICGAEFKSGQALGGHMRRHRTGLGAKTGASSLASMAMEEEEAEIFESKKQRSLSSLDLDLNLPPAPEQQPAIVFAASALVGCQY